MNKIDEKLLTELTQLEGQRIVRVIRIDSTMVAIGIDDGRWCVLEAGRCYDDLELEIHSTTSGLGTHNLIAMGLVDAEEVRRQELEFEARRQRQQEAAEKAEYERLKAKFGG
jgi:hypothetical protein